MGLVCLNTVGTGECYLTWMSVLLCLLGSVRECEGVFFLCWQHIC